MRHWAAAFLILQACAGPSAPDDPDEGRVRDLVASAAGADPSDVFVAVERGGCVAWARVAESSVDPKGRPSLHVREGWIYEPTYCSIVIRGSDGIDVEPVRRRVAAALDTSPAHVWILTVRP